MKVALVIMLVLAAYVGSYFAVLALPSSFHFGPARAAATAVTLPLKIRVAIINGEQMADYHGVPSAFFAPIHALDKRWLRHSYWFTPHDQELSFDWMLGKEPQ